MFGRRVQLDFTGPYGPGVVGSTVALVGAETEDNWESFIPH